MIKNLCFFASYVKKLTCFRYFENIFKKYLKKMSEIIGFTKFKKFINNISNLCIKYGMLIHNSHNVNITITFKKVKTVLNIRCLLKKI